MNKCVIVLLMAAGSLRADPGIMLDAEVFYEQIEKDNPKTDVDVKTENGGTMCRDGK